MKNKYLLHLLFRADHLLVLLFLTLFMSVAISTNAASGRISSTINALDSVIIDLDQAVYSSGNLDIPVYFKSDDTIYALDFAFRLNTASATFDTIIKQVPFNVVYNLNPQDSILRLTSYSINSLPNQTQILTIRLNYLINPVIPADFTNVEAYLNGFPCSFRIGPGFVSSLPEVFSLRITAYPNPFSDHLYVTGNKDARYLLYTESGNIALEGLLSAADDRKEIDTGNLPTGVYLLEIRSHDFLSRKKVVLFR